MTPSGGRPPVIATPGGNVTVAFDASDETTTARSGNGALAMCETSMLGASPDMDVAAMSCLIGTGAPAGDSNPSGAGRTPMRAAAPWLPAASPYEPAARTASMPPAYSASGAPAKS